MEPVFKAGDQVTFELSDNTDSYPRWSFSQDLYGSGKWGTGIVEHTDETIVLTTYTGADNIISTWQWPLQGNSDYHPNQWQRPGYLKHLHRHHMVLHDKAEILCTTSK